MKRREFITFLGGAAAAWPVAARAQQPRVPIIGFLRSTTATSSAYLVAAFRHGLGEAGYVEGQNVTVDYCWADGRSAGGACRRFGGSAGNPNRNEPEGARAAKAATATIPIVFATGGDPIALGLVPSLNRPGGNVTGVVFFFAVLGAKRLELLRQVVPDATTIAMLVNRSSPNAEGERKETEAAIRADGREPVVLDVASVRDIEVAFATLAQRGASALLVGSGAFLNSQRERIVELAARYRLPVMYAQREAALAGGLMSYGPSIADAYRQAGVYAGRILKGEKPADLPIVQAARFEFVINLRTAKSIGVQIPDKLLALADEVIE
jgi:putative tryptophan/tyrosine transport system substrate-binding protein